MGKAETNAERPSGILQEFMMASGLWIGTFDGVAEVTTRTFVDAEAG
ncbi:MAG: hypothetical protein ACRDJC_11000 [Thermomicrobiales bacterium]